MFNFFFITPGDTNIMDVAKLWDWLQSFCVILVFYMFVIVIIYLIQPHSQCGPL